jgi:hypothetical protein
MPHKIVLKTEEVPTEFEEYLAFVEPSTALGRRVRKGMRVATY